MNKLKKGETLNPYNLHKDVGLREFYSMETLHGNMVKMAKVWSWGAHKWTRYKNWWLGFKVSGHHHKGLVYICVNTLDLFTVILTNNKNKIVDIIEDVYISELIDTIDKKVEYIDEYENR